MTLCCGSTAADVCRGLFCTPWIVTPEIIDSTNITGFADMPISQLFPFLYRAFPKSYVVMGRRDETVWGHMRKRKHANSFLPLLNLFSGSVKSNLQQRSFWNSNIAELLYATEELMYTCMVPREKMILVDLIDHHNDTDDTVEKDICKFLGQPVIKLDPPPALQ